MEHELKVGDRVRLTPECENVTDMEFEAGHTGTVVWVDPEDWPYPIVAQIDGFEYTEDYDHMDEPGVRGHLFENDELERLSGQEVLAELQAGLLRTRRPLGEGYYD